MYSEALQREFDKKHIPYEKEKKLQVFYEGEPLKKYFRADFVCYESIIIELKATKYSVNANVRQTLNNVKATNYRLGILVNFGTPSLTYKRIVN